MARHLGHRHARQRTEQFARRGVDAVVPAEVARVVIGDRASGRGVLGPGRLARPRHRHEALLPHQLVEQLGVVDDLVVAADLRVFVLQRVVAVGAGDDDLGRADLVEHLDVLHREHLEEHLVAGAASGVTGAGLAVSEHGIRHAGGVEQLGDGARGALGAVLESTRATDPEQVVDRRAVLDIGPDDRDVERQPLGPVHPHARGQPPRVGVLLEVLVERPELAGEGARDEVLVAAHVDDRVDVLDVDRALLDAGATRGARPQDVLVDDALQTQRVVCRQRVLHVVTQRSHQRRVGQLLGVGGEVLALLLGRHEPRRLGVRVVAQRHDEQLRRERLVGVPRRALALAAATLGARREVEQTLPGELLDLADAQRGVLVEVLHRLHVERLAGDHHRLHGTEGGAPVGVPLEVDVDERQEAVPRDTHRRGERDGDHPREAHEDLDHRDEVDELLDGALVGALPQPLGAPSAEREVQDERLGGVVDLHEASLEGAQHHDAEHDGEDRELDVVGLPPHRPEEPRAAPRGALRGPGVVALPDPDEHADPDEPDPREQLDEPLERHESTDDRQPEIGPDQLEERIDEGREEQEEAQRREPVRDGDDRQPRKPGVPEELAQHRPHPRGRVVVARRVRRSGLEQPIEAVGLPEQQCPPQQRNREAQHDRGDLQGAHGCEV